MKAIRADAQSKISLGCALYARDNGTEMLIQPVQDLSYKIRASD